MKQNEIIDLIKCNLKRFLNKDITPSSLKAIQEQLNGFLSDIAGSPLCISTYCKQHPIYANEIVVGPKNLLTAILITGLGSPLLPELIPETGVYEVEGAPFKVCYYSESDWGIIPMPFPENISVDIGFMRGEYVGDVFICHDDVDRFMAPYIEQAERIVYNINKQHDDVSFWLSQAISRAMFRMETPDWRLKNAIYKF